MRSGNQKTLKVILLIDTLLSFAAYPIHIRSRRSTLSGFVSGWGDQVCALDKKASP